jgi:hypothetical protein
MKAKWLATYTVAFFALGVALYLTFYCAGR